MKNRYLLISILLLSACASRKEKAAAFFRQNPGQIAVLCADAFPIKERLISGKEIIQMDTAKTAALLVPCPPHYGQKTAFISCPGSKVVTRKVFRTDTLIKENTARISYLSDQLLKSNYDRDRFQKRSNYMAYLISAFLFVSVWYLFRKAI